MQTWRPIVSVSKTSNQKRATVPAIRRQGFTIERESSILIVIVVVRLGSNPIRVGRTFEILVIIKPIVPTISGYCAHGLWYLSNLVAFSDATRKKPTCKKSGNSREVRLHHTHALLAKLCRHDNSGFKPSSLGSNNILAHQKQA
jgi:hypothetical protein